MRITLIGTGRLGTNLHAALGKAGHDVDWLRGREVPTRLGEVVVICVKDDAIPFVAKTLQPLISETSALVVHTAGSIAMDTLPFERRGVLYPMQTFSRERMVNFAEIPRFTEASTPEDTKLLELLARSISRKVYALDSEKRKYLHLAAVFACNFVNHCYHLSSDILQTQGIPFEVMLPLIDETAQKVHNLSPRLAQTGPAVRYDKSVIRRHEDMLEGTTKEIYHLMSKSIHDKL